MPAPALSTFVLFTLSPFASVPTESLYRTKIFHNYMLPLQVRYLSSIQHPNLVTLLGYCQENNLQFLVYEYVPNGSVSCHLYGLAHLHSLSLLWCTKISKQPMFLWMKTSMLR